MNDPHVESLSYSVITDEGLEFSVPPPRQWQTSRFTVTLSDGAATVTMHDHHPSEDEARRVVDPVLAAWEIQAAIDWQLHGRELRFIFRGSTVIDRAPTGNNVYGTVSVVQGLAWNVEAKGTVTKPTYPEPPTSFSLDADVETLWNRFEGYMKGREPLQAMAYFCLSVLEVRAGGRRLLPTSPYRISDDVRNKMGDLVSEYGDALTARKLDKKVKQFQPLSADEKAWVEAVIRRLILRAGEVAHDRQRGWPLLTMTDFPQL